MDIILIDKIPQYDEEEYDFENLETIEDCVVCFESNSSIITTCNHEYYNPCIQEWCKRDKSRPYCRKILFSNNLFLIKRD